MTNSDLVHILNQLTQLGLIREYKTAEGLVSLMYRNSVHSHSINSSIPFALEIMGFIPYDRRKLGQIHLILGLPSGVSMGLNTYRSRVLSFLPGPSFPKRIASRHPRVRFNEQVKVRKYDPFSDEWNEKSAQLQDIKSPRSW
ncbi:hypothetical protein [Enterobacter ludwigii]|uniref:hypothetical protein n=1 Tax=Enterobacter ludwigii TaxID=299767 RepID=UPI00397472C8